MIKSLLFSLVVTVALASSVDVALSAESQAAAPLVINEVMASNTSTIQDPQGQYDDWIEIHNFGSEAVNVGGMYLTDKLSDPTQWRIPTDRPVETTIPAFGYLLIWADNDVEDAGLHANFKLGAGGETLGLFAPTAFGANGVISVDVVVIGEQTEDISFGRYPDASDDFMFMVSPTPGAKNTVGYIDTVGCPEFSHAHGFYNDPFSVVLTTATEGATIYYTLDGSEPDADEMVEGASNGIRYTDAIHIDKTTCLRAKAVKEGWNPSRAIASSYLFLDDVFVQSANPVGFPSRWGSKVADYEMDPDIVEDDRYRDKMKDALTSIPTMSIVMNKDHMFGNEGVYTNPQADIEKPTSVELIYPGGTEEGFQVNCGIKIIGGASRHMSKKNSLRLLFKSAYGPTKLRFPLFGDAATDTFNTIVLRSSFNDGYGWSGARFHEQYTRDMFILTMQREMGHVSPTSIPVHLYINGLYWGLYFPCERPDASFAATYYGGKEEDWDTFSHKSLSLREGDDAALGQMTDLCRQASNSTEAYYLLQGKDPNGSRNSDLPCLMDVTSYVDYLILNYCSNNEDWPWNNYWFGRRRGPESTGFKFFSWDSEISLYLPPRAHMNLNRTLDYRDVGTYHGYLIKNEEYRLFFADRVHHHLFNDGVLTPATMKRFYREAADQVETPVICESARWGDMHHSTPLDQDDWYAARDWLLENYFDQRHSIVLQQLKNAGLFPEVDAPIFYINGDYQYGGDVPQSAQLTMEHASGTVYYTTDGSDPRTLEAPVQTSPPKQLVLEDAAKRVFIPAGPLNANWKDDPDFDDSTWLSGTGGVGYEKGSGYETHIGMDVGAEMYNGNTSCFIRIPFTLEEDPANFDSLVLNVYYDDGFIAYLNGVEVQRVNFTGTPAWDSRADGLHEAGIAESFDLSNYLADLVRGDNLLAIQALNVVPNSSDFILSVGLIAGQDDVTPDGSTVPQAMAYTDPLVMNKSLHIKSRVLDGGAWSALNEATFAVGPVVESLRITEIMYHPQDTGGLGDPNEEFIELQNIGTETINLNLVRLTNGIYFTFPDIDLVPGQSIVVVEDQAAFVARYGADIPVAGSYTGRLANDGERIRLEDALGQTILDFKYSDNWYDSTDGKGYSLTILDASHADIDSWNQKESWRASPQLGGSPGL